LPELTAAQHPINEYFEAGEKRTPGMLLVGVGLFLGLTD